MAEPPTREYIDAYGYACVHGSNPVCWLSPINRAGLALCVARESWLGVCGGVRILNPQHAHAHTHTHTQD